MAVNYFTRKFQDYTAITGNGILSALKSVESGTVSVGLINDAGPTDDLARVMRLTSEAGGDLGYWLDPNMNYGSTSDILAVFNLGSRTEGSTAYLFHGACFLGTTFHGIRITQGADSSGDVLRVVKGSPYDYPVPEQGSDYPYPIDITKWYGLRMRATGTHVYVRIWEYGSAEPDVWNMDVSVSSYTEYGYYLSYGTEGAQELNLAFIGITSNPTSYPISVPLTFNPGDGAITFSEFDSEGFGGGTGHVEVDIAPDGYGNFCGDVEHSEFVPDGYGNFAGSVAFPGAELAGESWVGGIGVIDFPEFGIHQAISGNGEIHEDTRDLFDYTGRSGALGSVSFSMGLLAAGSQLVSGNAETSFGTFTLDGDGNFSGTVSFEDTLIDASGSSFPVGRASIDWSISVGGAGKVGTVEAGSSPVEFPAFQISGAGTVRVVGHAAMDFERFEADGVALPGCSGDGVIVLPFPVVLASGQHLPRGEGAIEFSIDLPSSGCYGHSDRYRYPILRFERHP